MPLEDSVLFVIETELVVQGLAPLKCGGVWEYGLYFNYYYLIFAWFDLFDQCLDLFLVLFAVINLCFLGRSACLVCCVFFLFTIIIY